MVSFSVRANEIVYECQVKSLKFSYGWERADTEDCLQEGRDHVRQIESDARALVAA